MTAARYPRVVYRLARLAGKPVHRAARAAARVATRDLLCVLLDHDPSVALAVGVGNFDEDVCRRCLRPVPRRAGGGR